MGYFKPQEFLPPIIFNKLGNLGMRYLNPKIIVIMEYLREEIDKPIRINDWFIGGNLSQRGIRTKDSAYYRPYSDHTFGNAVDFDIKNTEAKTIQERILSEFADDLITLGLTGIEDNTDTWTHLSVSNLSAWKFAKKNGIYLIPR